MATTSYGTPYVQSSDLVSGWPNASLNVADRIDAVSYAGNGINAQTGTSYTLAVTDAGKLVTLNNAAAVAVTLPQDSTANLPTGAVVNFYNLGAGTVTISQGSGATLQGGSLQITQYGYASVVKLSANTYGPYQPTSFPRSAVDKVDTSQTTTSTTYTDLATVGPQVTITTGTKALVIWTTFASNSSAGPEIYASVAISGATTLAASNDWCAAMGSTLGGYIQTLTRAYIFTGLTAGSNTFTVKYRQSSGTSTFSARTIVAYDLGS